jgi:hypothetical protein
MARQRSRGLDAILLTLLLWLSLAPAVTAAKPDSGNGTAGARTVPLAAPAWYAPIGVADGITRFTDRGAPTRSRVREQADGCASHTRVTPAGNRSLPDAGGVTAPESVVFGTAALSAVRLDRARHNLGSGCAGFHRERSPPAA